MELACLERGLVCDRLRLSLAFLSSAASGNRFVSPSLHNVPCPLISKRWNNHLKPSMEWRSELESKQGVVRLLWSSRSHSSLLLCVSLKMLQKMQWYVWMVYLLQKRGAAWIKIEGISLSTGSACHLKALESTVPSVLQIRIYSAHLQCRAVLTGALEIQLVVFCFLYKMWSSLTEECMENVLTFPGKCFRWLLFKT